MTRFIPKRTIPLGEALNEIGWQISSDWTKENLGFIKSPVTYKQYKQELFWLLITHLDEACQNSFGEEWDKATQVFSDTYFFDDIPFQTATLISRNDEESRRLSGKIKALEILIKNACRKRTNTIRLVLKKPLDTGLINAFLIFNDDELKSLVDRSTTNPTQAEVEEIFHRDQKEAPIINAEPVELELTTLEDFETPLRNRLRNEYKPKFYTQRLVSKIISTFRTEAHAKSFNCVTLTEGGELIEIPYAHWGTMQSMDSFSTYHYEGNEIFAGEGCVEVITKSLTKITTTQQQSKRGDGPKNSSSINDDNNAPQGRAASRLAVKAALNAIYQGELPSHCTQAVKQEVEQWLKNPANRAVVRTVSSRTIEAAFSELRTAK